VGQHSGILGQHDRNLQHGMYDAMLGLVQSKKLSSINADQLLALLLQQEWDERNNRKITG